MIAIANAIDRHGFSPAQYFICLKGIVWREALRFIHQRERFVSALVRPLVWLLIFAAGFRQVLGVSIIPPYETYVLYEVYITPGLIAMIQLFNGMQSSLTMVYDRETGGMRTLLVSPFPRWWLLASKLLAGTLVSVLQAYAFLLIAWFWEIEAPPLGYLALLPALLLLRGRGLLDILNDLSTISTFGFLLAYVLISIAAPVYLRRIGGLSGSSVLCGVASVLFMLPPLLASVYPVPAAPADKFPWYFLGYLGIGGVWFLALCGRGSGELLRQIRRDLETG